MKNKEFSKNLSNIMKLLENNEHMVDKVNSSNYNIVMNKFIELLIDGNIFIQSIHAEVILRNLIKGSNSKFTERPDFSKKELESVKILRIGESILKNPAVTLGISFERLQGQFANIETYSKDKSSRFDNFFK